MKSPETDWIKMTENQVNKLSLTHITFLEETYHFEFWKSLTHLFNWFNWFNVCKATLPFQSKSGQSISLYYILWSHEIFAMTKINILPHI